MERSNAFLKSQYMKFLFPVMLSIMGGTINTLIDSAFLSVRLGSDVMASVNLAIPAYLLLCTLGSLFGSGASVMSARALGRENPVEANKYFHIAVAWNALAGAVITVLGMLLSGPLAVFLAQGGNLTGFVKDYIFWLFAGSIPTMAIYLPIYYLQLEARVREAYLLTAMIFGTNLVLDYIFLYPVSMGPAGAAVATSLSMLIACVYGIAALFRKGGNFSFDKKLLGFGGSLRLFHNGSTVALGNLVDAVRIFILNSLILFFLGNKYVAVWAVLNAICEVSMMITSGVPQTASMMTGLYYSAKENGSIRILTRLQIQIGTRLLIGFSAILLILSEPLRRLYDLDTPIIFPLVCLILFFYPDLTSSILSRHYNVIERIRLSNFVTIIRRLVFPVFFCWVLVNYSGYVWLFLPLGAVATNLVIWEVTGVISDRSPAGSHHLSRPLLLDDYLEKERKVLDFSVEADNDAICTAAERIREFCELNNVELKLSTRLSMAIEELLVMLSNRIENVKEFDLRAFMGDNMLGIRIRCIGDSFDPFAPEYEDDEDMMGVQMIKKLATDVTQSHAMGMNTIHIFFDR